MRPPLRRRHSPLKSSRHRRDSWPNSNKPSGHSRSRDEQMVELVGAGVGKVQGGGQEFGFGSIKGYATCEMGDHGGLGVGKHTVPREALGRAVMESRTDEIFEFGGNRERVLELRGSIIKMGDDDGRSKNYGGGLALSVPPRAASHGVCGQFS